MNMVDITILEQKDPTKSCACELALNSTDDLEGLYIVSNESKSEFSIIHLGQLLGGKENPFGVRFDLELFQGRLLVESENGLCCELSTCAGSLLFLEKREDAFHLRNISKDKVDWSQHKKALQKLGIDSSIIDGQRRALKQRSSSLHVLCVYITLQKYTLEKKEY